MGQVVHRLHGHGARLMSDQGRPREEFRVVWKRVGCRPKAKRFVRRSIAERFMQLFGPEPWSVFADRGENPNPESLVCCCGYQCGCGGLTYRQQSEERRENQPGLEYVRLDVRVVGPWAAVPSVIASAAVLSDSKGRG